MQYTNVSQLIDKLNSYCIELEKRIEKLEQQQVGGNNSVINWDWGNKNKKSNNQDKDQEC